MMKIFFLTRGLHDSGGIERVTTVIANELSTRGYEVGIVCLQKRGEPFFEVNKKVKIHYIDDENVSCCFNKKVKKLKLIYQRESPDVIVAAGSHRSFTNVPAAEKIPLVTWEHFNANVNWHPLHSLSRKLAVKHSAKIVTLTKQDAEIYKRKFNAQNAITIPNPVTLNNISPSPLTSKRVIAVGRLANQKGFDMLLEAWSKCESREQGWELRIVGSGRWLKKLNEIVEKLDLKKSVEIVPATKNIAQEYENATLFAMSSRYEGLPLVLIEAMAYGLPIVSFDCETGPREIIKDGKTGILVKANDTSELARSLDSLMQDSIKRELFAQNSKVECERFLPENIIPIWEKLFDEIVKKDKK